MIKKTVEDELRFYLLGLSALAFAGAIVELWLIEHYEEFVQIIPFILCGFGLILVLLTMRSKSKKMLKILRYTSLVIAAGGLFGIYEHLSGNIAFEMELHSDYTFWTAFWEGLGGATPLLAPGVLIFGGLLAILATWKHPVLSEK